MQVKICGITNENDALTAAQQGVNYLGYILNYPESPRFISAPQAKKIIDRVRLLFPKVKHVGIFVDATSETINDIIKNLQLEVVQLHGNESVENIEKLNDVVKWKAIELQSEDDLEKIKLYENVVDGILLDSGKGSGKTITQDLLKQASIGKPVILAGGLSPSNIQAMCKLYYPTVVDINSGIESVPGKKDDQQIELLLAELAK